MPKMIIETETGSPQGPMDLEHIKRRIVAQQ